MPRIIQLCCPVDWGRPYTESIWTGSEDLEMPDGRDFEEIEDLRDRLKELGYREVDTDRIVVSEPNNN